MPIALEANACFRQLPVPLNVDMLVRVHQDVGDRGIFQQRLQGSQTEDLVQNFFGQAISLRHADRKMIFTKDFFEDALHLPAQFMPAFGFDSIHVQHTQKLLVHARLEIRVAFLALWEGRNVSAAHLASFAGVGGVGRGKPEARSQKPE